MSEGQYAEEQPVKEIGPMDGVVHNTTAIDCQLHLRDASRLNGVRG
jgi:hypothetical protein